MAGAGVAGASPGDGLRCGLHGGSVARGSSSGWRVTGGARPVKLTERGERVLMLAVAVPDPMLKT